MRAAVEDVHHRHRQQVGVRAADVAVERQAGRVGGGARDRERDAEDRVGAELRLVGRAVELEHRLVDEPLVVGVEALDRRADRLDHAVDGLARRPCRGSGRRRRAARPPRTRRWRRRWAPPRGRTSRRRGATSTSTVGLPRESRISRAPTASMDATVLLLVRGRAGQPSRAQPRPGRPPRLARPIAALRPSGVRRRAGPARGRRRPRGPRRRARAGGRQVVGRVAVVTARRAGRRRGASRARRSRTLSA